MYDKDSSGEIDLEEMVEIFCLMYAVQVLTNTSPSIGFFFGVLLIEFPLFCLQGFSEAEATERAEKIFHTLDR